MIAKFQSIINSNQPVLVDFYADWCGPCKQMPPILKDVKEDLKQNVRIIKVDVDKNPQIATKYKIRSIPTIMIFKNGASIWKGLGVRPAHELKAVLREHINR
jgi:thioredoxin 1